MPIAPALLDAKFDRLYDHERAHQAARDAGPEMLAICKEFVRRVEAGEVRSKRTYAAMKAVIAKVEGK